jgi:hypothetical protein
MFRCLFLVCVVVPIVGPLGCSKSEPPEPGSHETTGEPTTTSSTGAGASSSSGGAASSSDGSSSSSSSSSEESSSTGGVSICWRDCTEPADCCLPGSGPECPGDFPYDYACNDGLCKLLGCSGDEDCQPAPQFEYLTCHPYLGTAICLTVCESNDDCPEGRTCTGTTDDDLPFCAIEDLQPECFSDDDCEMFYGGGHCIDERCICTDNADCTAGDVCVPERDIP